MIRTENFKRSGKKVAKKEKNELQWDLPGRNKCRWPSTHRCPFRGKEQKMHRMQQIVRKKLL